MKKIKVAVLGAGGIVGKNLFNLLQDEPFVDDDIKLLSSEKSAGKRLRFRNKDITVNTPDDGCFDGIDLAFFATDEKISTVFAPKALLSGARVIDNSGAFRLNCGVPLVVPEINARAIKNKMLIANPNCTTVQCAIPLYALKKRFGLASVSVCTYQSVSGAGKAALKEYFSKEPFAVSDEKTSVFGCDIKTNCIPKIGSIFSDGYSEEELKIVNETKKILGDKRLPVSAFCVRVPVPYCHGAFVQARLKKTFCVFEALSAFKSTPEIVTEKPKNNPLCDENSPYCPINSDARGSANVFLGRIRKNKTDGQILEFFVTADNLLRGAAANAVMIARKIYCKK